MAESIVRPGYDNPKALVFERASFFETDLDNFTKPPAQNPDDFTTLENVEPNVDNQLKRRRGNLVFSNPTVAARRITEAHYLSGANRLILAAADGTGVESKSNMITAINENGARGHATNDILIPASGAYQPSIAVSRQYAYIADGVSGDLKKWDGQDNPSTAGSVTDWGLSASGAVFTAASAGSGDLTLEVGRKYKIAFLYSTTGEAVLYDITSGGTTQEHTEDAVDSGAVSSVASVDLASLPTYTIGSSGFVAANIHRVLLATSDGGPLDTLYEVGRITNNTTTTFSDTYLEETLLASPVWAEVDANGTEIGIYDNTRPSTTIATVKDIIEHNNRLYALDEQNLYWSKSPVECITSTSTITGRYESCWPASYQLPIAAGSEFGRALLSDGINLYIATDRSVSALGGDYPLFNGPLKLFREVGVIRQDVWKLIYHEGQQIGSIWLTPDKRVIASDFNTYGDIGRPIQTTLDAMDMQGAARNANASFMSQGPYELYALAIPSPGTNNTINSGTAQAGASTTITLAAAAAASNDFYNGATVNITGGTGSGQSKTIIDYVGSSKVATVDSSWSTNPDGTSTYTVVTKECDTICVYDINRKRWTIWKPTDTVYAQAFLQDIVNRRSLWVFSTENGSPVDGRVYRWYTEPTELATANNHRDRTGSGETPVSYVSTIRTSWLDWGLPQVTKFLNELELMTGDSGLTVGVEGASTAAGFDSPTTVLSATAVTAAPFGQYKLAGLATTASKYRFYRFTFTSPAGTTIDLLDYLAIEAIPFHRY